MVGPRDPTQSVLGDTRAAPADSTAKPAEPPAPEIPSFRLLSKLGQGGQGSVWLAEQLDGLGKRCALKVFPHEAQASYERELEAWKRVEEIRRATGTPHLVEGYAAAVTPKGVAFVAMAFFERGSLADRLVADGPFSSPAGVRYARHVLAALDLLHQHGLWHRDVKPQNILLGNDGIARLADYGLSKRLGATVTASCTPAFAAPEQLAGETDADGVKIDIYGVAATLFALLTGKPPVPGRPDVFLLERRKVPRAVHAPLLRALNPDPAQRYQRAAEFAHALALAEPASSAAGYAADVVSATPVGERPVHEALTAETRAADPDRPLATTPPGAFGLPQGASELQTTRGRRARRARLALLGAGLLFLVALGLDALTDSRRGPVETRIHPPEERANAIRVSEVLEPIPLAKVRGLGAGEGALALTGSGTVWIASTWGAVAPGGGPPVPRATPQRTLALATDPRRAVPWTRDRALVARAGGELELVGALGAWPLPAADRVVEVAGHAPSGRIAYATESGAVHVLRLDGQDRIARGSSFHLRDPAATSDSEPRASVTSLAFDESGERLAVASVLDPEGGGRIALYTLDPEPRLDSLLERPGPTGVAWLAPTALAVADAEDVLTVIDPRDGSIGRVLPFDGTIVSLARSPARDVLLVLVDERKVEGEEVADARLRLFGWSVAGLAGRGEVRPSLDATSFK